MYEEGIAELKRNNYNGSLKKLLGFISAEETAKTPDSVRLADAYYYVGGIYTVYQDFAHALEVYKKGYALSRGFGDGERQFKFLNNMIGASCEIKKDGHAERLNREIMRLKGVDRGRATYYYFFNKGFIAGSRGDNRAKARWMQKAVETVDRYRLDGTMKVYAWSEIYKCYEDEGRLDKALEVLLKYDTLAHEMNQAYLYVDCYKGLMRIYTKLGDKDKALFYYGEYFKYADSLLNVNDFSQIKTEYQAGEKRRTDTTINNLEKANSQQKLILVLLAVIVAVTTSAVAVFYRQRQRLHGANVELYKRNSELLEIESRYGKLMEERSKAEETLRHEETDGRGQAAANHDRLIKSILKVMENEDTFCNPDFSQAMLARLTESNTNYVSQAINTTFNKNFRSFVNEYRIKVAMKRMADTARWGNYSILGIAESVGFKSASNFIEAFKKITGMTPSLYRRMSDENGGG